MPELYFNSAFFYYYYDDDDEDILKISQFDQEVFQRSWYLAV